MLQRLRAGLAHWRCLQGPALHGVLFALGAMGVLAHAPFHIQPAMAAALTALVLSLDAARRTRRPGWAAFARAWSFAAGQFLAGTFWVANAFLVSAQDHAWLIWAPLTLLPGGLALFWGVAGALYARFAPRGPARVLMFAATFLVAELARATLLSGFPWNLPGHVFPAGGAISQSASLVGAFGLSALVLLSFASPAALIGSGDAWRKLVPLVLGVTLLSTAQLYGVLRLSLAEAERSGERIRVIQLAIDQADKRYARRLEIFDAYLAHSLAPGLDEIDLLVWPEGAVPTLLLEDETILQVMRDRLPHHVYLVSGTQRAEWRPDGTLGEYFNALAVLDPTDPTVQPLVYDKVRLVPFGEGNPLRAVTRLVGFEAMTPLGQGYTPGSGPQTLAAPGLPSFAPLICYEVVYARFAPRGADRPQWLLNISNDSWYGDSSGPRQHFNQARYRAIEEGLPMVRAASKGISGQVDPFGRPDRVLDLDANGPLDLVLLEPLDEPIYARYGNIPWMFAWTVILMAAGFAISPDRKTRMRG